MATASSDRDHILPFAFQLFDNTFTYLGLGRELPPMYEQINNLPRTVDRYTQDIGDAVIGMSYAFRVHFKKTFTAMEHNLMRNENCYKHYVEIGCVTFMRKVFDLNKKDSQGRKVFQVFMIFILAAYIAEISAFAYRRGMTSALELAPGTYKYLFEKYVADLFLAAGNWNDVNGHAAMLAKGYRKLQKNIDYDPELEVELASWQELSEYFHVPIEDLKDMVLEQAPGSKPEECKYVGETGGTLLLMQPAEATLDDLTLSRLGIKHININDIVQIQEITEEMLNRRREERKAEELKGAVGGSDVDYRTMAKKQTSKNARKKKAETPKSSGQKEKPVVAKSSGQKEKPETAKAPKSSGQKEKPETPKSSEQQENPEVTKSSGQKEKPVVTKSSGQKEKPETSKTPKSSGQKEKPETPKSLEQQENPEVTKSSGQKQKPVVAKSSGQKEKPETSKAPKSSGQKEKPETPKSSEQQENPEVTKSSGQKQKPETSKSSGQEKPETPKSTGQEKFKSPKSGKKGKSKKK